VNVRQRDGLLVAEANVNAFLRRTRWPLTASLGYFAGLGVPTLTGVSASDGIARVAETFFASPLQTSLTVLALLAALTYGLVAPALVRRASRRTLDRGLLNEFRRFVDPLFLDAEHELEGVAWGQGQTILACPRPEVGWSTTDVAFRLIPARYDFSVLERMPLPGLRTAPLAHGYREYLKDVYPQQYGYDNDKLMLARRPHSFTDDMQLRLEIQVTQWSQLQYFWQCVVTDETKPALYAAALDSDRIPFPNSLCLHLLVFSADGALLLTQTHSGKANDYPGSWACSVGEQLSTEDVLTLDQDCAQKWVTRALHEEVAVEPGEYDPRQIRFLALTFEGDIANMAMVCAVHLSLSQEDVAARLRTANRLDNEFSSIEFVDIESVPRELVCPSRAYHPSTGIRMVYAYLHQRGQNALRRGLARELGLRADS